MVRKLALLAFIAVILAPSAALAEDLFTRDRDGVIIGFNSAALMQSIQSNSTSRVEQALRSLADDRILRQYAPAYDTGREFDPYSDFTGRPLMNPYRQVDRLRQGMDNTTANIGRAIESLIHGR